MPITNRDKVLLVRAFHRIGTQSGSPVWIADFLLLPRPQQVTAIKNMLQQMKNENNAAASGAVARATETSNTVTVENNDIDNLDGQL